jgi:hypothetical protein
MSDSDSPASEPRDQPAVPPDTSQDRSNEPSGTVLAAGRGATTATPWRLAWTGAAALLLVAALLTTLSVVARYARDEVINTDEYVATVTPLASDPAVQNAVANRVSNEVIQKLDVPKLIHDLAEATGRPNADAIASAIAGPVNDAVEGFVHKTVLTFVQSPEFERLWVSANTRHTQLSAVLTGEGTEVVKTQGNQIIVEVGPIVDQVSRTHQLGAVRGEQDPSVSVQVPVMTENLPAIQSYVNLLDNPTGADCRADSVGTGIWPPRCTAVPPSSGRW